MDMMECKYVDVKVRRRELDCELTKSVDLSKQVTEMTKEYIKKLKEEGGMNLAFYNHPRPKTIQEAMNSDMQYSIGKIEDIDDEFVYCKICENKMNDIDLNKLRADIVYLVEYPYDTGIPHVFEINRVNLVDFE